jgi:SAM-dependent methyltransferase
VSLTYRLLYLVGFTPWDTDRVPDELAELIEGEGALQSGQALDLGCGTGTQAVYLAGRGWEVSAIDAIEKPLRRARARASAQRVSVEWIRGDVTRLPDLGLAPGYTLVFDRGCFHGLRASERAAYGAGVTQLAAPGATLLMLSFARNAVPVGPSGADESEIVQALSGWELVAAAPDRGPAPGGPLARVPRSWYRFIRRRP